MIAAIPFLEMSVKFVILIVCLVGLQYDRLIWIIRFLLKYCGSPAAGVCGLFVHVVATMDLDLTSRCNRVSS